MLTYRDTVFSIIFIVIVFTKISEANPPTSRPTVTNNDIRDAILQIVNVIRTTEDKLERHEYREKALGEQLKRGLISIDRRGKQWDHFKGAITRLDERLAAVETILIQKEERERLQALKTFDAVDDIQKNLPLIMEELKKDILNELAKQKKATPPPTSPPPPPKPEITKKDFEGLKSDIIEQVDKVNESVTKLEKQVKNIKADKDECKDLNEKTYTNMKKIDKKLDKEDDLLQKYEGKLGEYKNCLKEVPAQMKEQAEWQAKFLKTLKEQKNRTEEVLEDVKSISNKLNYLPEKRDLKTLENNTNNLVKEINRNTDDRTRRITEDITDKIKDVKAKLTEDHIEIKESINGLSNLTENLGADIGKSHKDIKSDLQSVKKMEKVLTQSAENVLDTKRRLEYGIAQILAEIGRLMKESTKEIANTISERFDVFELSVLDDDNGILANLTNKVGDDIDQVWRHFGELYEKVNNNAGILNKLQNQTDVHLNGSANIMDSMKLKVSKITSKVVELDENLNYLMGKLMLLSHEFNEIKKGLSKTLDEIKGTFNAVQKKIQEFGPGPYKIDNDEDPTAK